VPTSRRADPAIALHGVVQLASWPATCLATCKRRMLKRARTAHAQCDGTGTTLDRFSNDDLTARIAEDL
jgi:hypothetical protein